MSGSIDMIRKTGEYMTDFIECAICGRRCHKRRFGYYCTKCKAYTSHGIEAAEEE